MATARTRRALLGLGTLLAMLAAAAAWINEVLIAAALALASLVGYTLAIALRRAVRRGADAFQLAVAKLRDLADDQRGLRRPGAVWLQARIYARQAAEGKGNADPEGVQDLHASLAEMVDASFDIARARRKVTYDVVDDMLQAVGAAAELRGDAAGPVASALERRLWVELGDVPLAGRVEVLRRGIPLDAAQRAKPFDGPVFKRMVRDA